MSEARGRPTKTHRLALMLPQLDRRLIVGNSQVITDISTLIYAPFLIGYAIAPYHMFAHQTSQANLMALIAGFLPFGYFFGYLISYVYFVSYNLGDRLANRELTTHFHFAEPPQSKHGSSLQGVPSSHSSRQKQSTLGSLPLAVLSSRHSL